MGAQIRLATVADFPGFAVVAREVHEHHVAALSHIFRSVEVVVPEEYFTQLVTGEDSEICVAEVDGVIAGYAVLTYRRATREIQVPRFFAFVENFGVAAAHRRAGIGRQLIAACAERAKERGATSLELDCWEANQEAVAFYTALGMRTTRRYFAMDL